MRRAAALLFPLLILAACATPREACINDATRDLRRVNALIVETQQNLARGYGLESREHTRVVRSRCSVRAYDAEGNPVTYRYNCPRTEVYHTQVPVTLDLALEQRKLDQLLEQQRRLERQAEPQVQACIAAHPE